MTKEEFKYPNPTATNTETFCDKIPHLTDYAGAYTSATAARALSNVIPTLTFLMAVLLGMKKLKIRSTQGQAKVAGTIFCIGGSLILTFWKGGYRLKGVEKPLINVHNAEEYGKIKHVQKNWIKGSALILISYIAWSEWLILQVIRNSIQDGSVTQILASCHTCSLS
ncbi:hypothetical protein COP2_039648 [Malus domestica]